MEALKEGVCAQKKKSSGFEIYADKSLIKNIK